MYRFFPSLFGVKTLGIEMWCSNSKEISFEKENQASSKENGFYPDFMNKPIRGVVQCNAFGGGVKGSDRHKVACCFLTFSLLRIVELLVAIHHIKSNSKLSY